MLECLSELIRVTLTVIFGSIMADTRGVTVSVCCIINAPFASDTHADTTCNIAMMKISNNPEIKRKRMMYNISL